MVRKADREVALLDRLEHLHEVLDLDAAAGGQTIPFRDRHVRVERTFGQLCPLPKPRVPRVVQRRTPAPAETPARAVWLGGVSLGALRTRLADPLRSPSAGDLVVMVRPGPATGMPLR